MTTILQREIVFEFILKVYNITCQLLYTFQVGRIKTNDRVFGRLPRHREIQTKVYDDELLRQLEKCSNRYQDTEHRTRNTVIIVS